ncbi:phytanoyl-CoA dioxygenase family protein [Parapedomonas caeni]
MPSAARPSCFPPVDDSFETPAIADAIVETIQRHGFCIARGVADAARVNRVSEELTPWFDATPFAQGPFYGDRTVRFHAALNKSQACHALVLDPVVRDVCDALLGPYCDWMQLNLTQGLAIHPGAPAQPPHRDQNMWHGARYTHPFVINVMWCLDRFTPENGSTVFWPGSHRATSSAWLPDDQAVQATAEPGDVIFWLGETLHGGGANTTSAPRRGFLTSYCLGWLKTYENMFLTYPPEIAAGFSPELQALIGYRIHRPNLGGYEGQSPAILLDSGERPTRLGAIDYLLPEQLAMIDQINSRQEAAA